MKRVVFNLWSRGVVHLNRANIVGFRAPDPALVWTNVILDSGAEVSLNGVSMEEAEKILADFDENNPPRGQDER